MVNYTDPPGMPEDERMTPAEFRVFREYLGLTGDWLAEHLGVSARTVRHWEQGKYPIPDGVRLEIEDLEDRTQRFIDALVEKISGVDAEDRVVVTYRSDDECRAAHPDIEFPAAWHRAVVARIAYQVPGLSIVYPDSRA